MTIIGKHRQYMQDIPPDIQRSINIASGISGEPVEHLSRVMNLESKGDPRARNLSGAKGLFQIMPKTWSSLQRENPKRNFTDIYDPTQNATAAAILNKKYRDILSKSLNMPATGAQVSGAHYVGPGGYLSLVRNPDVPARTLFSPKTYSQNKSLFVDNGQERTGRQAIDYINTRYNSAPTTIPYSRPKSYGAWGDNNNFDITFNDRGNYNSYSEPTSRVASSSSRNYYTPSGGSYSEPARISTSPSSYKPSNSETVSKYWKGGTSFSNQ